MKKLQPPFLTPILGALICVFSPLAFSPQRVWSAPLQQPSGSKSSTGVSDVASPVTVQTALEKNSIRMGEPMRIRYQIANYSEKDSLVFVLPNEGTAWLTLRVQDAKTRQTVATATVTDFAGSEAVGNAITKRRIPFLWTRLHLGRQSYFAPPPDSVDGKMIRKTGTFSDTAVLGPSNFFPLPTGSYTVTIQVDLPYATEKSRPKFGYGSFEEDRGNYDTKIIHDATMGAVSFVSSPPNAVVQTVAHLHQTWTFPLEVRSEPTASRLETEALTNRLCAAYTPSSFGSSLLLPPDTLNKTVQNDLASLFVLSGPVARKAQLAVADAAFAAKEAGPRSLLFSFYARIAAVGTPEVADFLADQAWERNRPAALSALAALHYYGSAVVKKRVQEHFDKRHAAIPMVAVNCD